MSPPEIHCIDQDLDDLIACSMMKGYLLKKACSMEEDHMTFHQSMVTSLLVDLPSCH